MLLLCVSDSDALTIRKAECAENEDGMGRSCTFKATGPDGYQEAPSLKAGGEAVPTPGKAGVYDVRPTKDSADS